MTTVTTTESSARDARYAMRLSLWVGLAMMLGKTAAWWATGSAAILSDASESVIHVVAVGFAAWSLRLSQSPASARYPFGLDRISFFSAGFEGAMIVVAALVIIFEAVKDLIRGPELERIGLGTLAVAAAAVANGLLGWHLIRTGKRTRSLILEANGKHVLTDCWTSAGVIVGLLLVMATGWTPFDPICAIVVALNILYSGVGLIRQSVRGLMDYADPETESKLRKCLDMTTQSEGIKWHGLRFRETGGRLEVHVHLLFPWRKPLGEAHGAATRVETALNAAFNEPVDTVTHLEAVEDHDGIHPSPDHH